MSDKQGSVKVTAPKQARDDARRERDMVRQAADTYRAALMAAAAPPLPEKPPESETQKRRSSQRV